MGNCGSSLNCTTTGEPVQVDPDIAGIGVLISFIATACLTFVAIVLGYLLDSVPDDVLTDFDRAFLFKISQWSRSWQWRRNILTEDPTAQEFSLRYTPHDKARRLQRSQILERFILTLSDQQLVTGFGILIAGFKGLCTISFYNMNIITAIAWFSSTTHLSTLAILRGYLIDHPRIRNWRAAAMLCVFALLVVAQLAIAAPADFSAPAQCLFYSWAYWETIRRPGIPLAGTVLVVLFLIASYASRIARLYSSDPEWTLQTWLAKAMFRKGQQFPSVEQTTIIAHAKSPSEKGVAFRKIRYQRRVALYLERQKFEGSLIRYRLREVMFINQEIQRSFIGELQALLFGISFGITQLLIFRDVLGTTQIPGVDYLVGDENTIGFGQLVPLFLILLPIFAASEAYEETGKIAVTSGPIKGERIGLFHYQNFWHHYPDYIAAMDSKSSRSCGAHGLSLEILSNGSEPHIEGTDVELARQSPSSSPVQFHETTSHAEHIDKMTFTQSRLWITALCIIAGRTTLMALYGVTFAGAFSLINKYVGVGALAMAAFFCGGMMIMESIYLLRNSRCL